MTLPQAFTFNDEHQEIEIVDKEPPIPSVDEELVQNDQSQIEEPVIEHTNKIIIYHRYLFYIMWLIKTR